MSDRNALLREILRTDLAAFVEKCFLSLEPGTQYLDNWHVHAIAFELMRVWRGEERRLIINIPPRYMKSLTATVAFTAWALGHAPHKRIMAVSYAANLARKHAVDFSAIVTSDWFRATFPNFEIATLREGEIWTTKRGYRYAGSIGGSVTGWGADLILVDDPVKSLEAALSAAERRRVAEFYDGSLYTRLNNKAEGAIVIIMQRLHEDDLVGHVLEKENWRVLSIPAIAPEDCDYRIGDHPHQVYRRRAGEVLHPAREPQEMLELARRTLGTLNFSAQYQQSPVPAEGNAIKRDWIRRYDELPHEFDLKVASWDTASTLKETADWSVGSVWGAVGQQFYLLDVVRARLEAPDLGHRMVALAREHQVDVTLVEETELGRAIAQDLRRNNRLFPILNPVRFDKEARLLAQAARFESGQVHLPREAPWLGAYETELLAFPMGRHDDQVDSTSQALHYLTARTQTRGQRPQGRPRPQRRPRPTRGALRRPMNLEDIYDGG